MHTDESITSDKAADDQSAYPANTHDLQTYRDAQKALARFPVPILLHAKDGHERLYVAAFDGTGNDADGNPNEITNVGMIRNQISARQSGGNQSVAVGYESGIGTQSNAVTRLVDGALGYSYEARIEQMYWKFAKQVKLWRAGDPDVQVRLADIGFSRGAVEADGFARLVDERGVLDPSSRTVARDAQGREVVTYTRTLIPPGEIAQTLALLDPVATGVPRWHDRRPPPSVISGFQVIAEDERRGLFKSNHIIDPGMSGDGRFLGVVVGGAHSDIGGGYLRNGLAVLSGNLVIDYLNAQSDTPFLVKQPAPAAELDVVHRPERALPYRFLPRVDRSSPDGYDAVLVSPLMRGRVPDALDAEPMDVSLSDRFQRHPAMATPTPTAPASLASGVPEADASMRIDRLFDRLHAAARSVDREAIADTLSAYRRSPEGRQWSEDVQAHVQQVFEATRLQQPIHALATSDPERRHVFAMGH